MNSRTVKLTSLSPLEASLDRAKLVEEFKRRGNRETNTESRVTNTRVSAFATKSERKKSCVSTNKIDSTLVRVNVSLLQVNEGCFPKKILKEKPMKRLDSRTNHSKEGGNDMNQVRKSSSRHPTAITSPIKRLRKLGEYFGKRFTPWKSKESRPCLKAGRRPPALAF